MSERIDHVAEARKWLEYSENLNPEVDWPRIAHASLLLTSHATLAGVEQQRITNLIAWVEVDQGAINPKFKRNLYGPRIEEALGIS